MIVGSKLILSKVEDVNDVKAIVWIRLFRLLNIGSSEYLMLSRNK